MTTVHGSRALTAGKLLALSFMIAASDLPAQNAAGGGTRNSAQAGTVSVIPAPRSVVPSTGAWSPRDTVVVTIMAVERGDADRLHAAAHDVVVSALKRVTARSRLTMMPLPPGSPYRRAPGDTAASAIRIYIPPGADTAGGAESYRLQVAADGVLITAPTAAGAFYALQTLRQLGESAARTPGVLRIPGAVIDDAPRFTWRGMHLDVARHFFPVEFVKRYIDLMARYKFNTFHWHLTEDQGWRIEILKYPRLTEVGSCRAETMVARNFNQGDGIRYCGHYSQAEIRDVVAYARDRFVTIVPEIEMPGHAKSALAAYPELACTPGPFAVRTTWGVDEDVFCPSEQTFEFIRNVLDEVTGLFPGRYIHIGGDEVPKTRWRASALAQDIIKREGLKDEHELQSWFIRRVEQMLVAKNRRLVGWDEILEGGLAPQATVMSWRGTAGGIAAAREKHDVVMTPNSHLYFDHYQGDPRHEPLAFGGLSTLERVYAYEPVPDVLTPEQARHILGAQANLWSEYLKTPDAVEYMAYPRALALAEVVWSPRDARNWNAFVARLPSALRSLDNLGVNYRIPTVDGIESDQLTLSDEVTVTLRTLLTGGEIRYTTDGSDPTHTSARYERPFTVPLGGTGARVSARVFTVSGRASSLRAATFTKTTHRDAETVAPGSTTPGLHYAYTAVSVRNTRGIDTLRATRSGVAATVSLPDEPRAERYALRLSGLINVPADGLYEFALGSDDGSVLAIGDRTVVDNDGAHGMEEKFGMIALRAGHHPITVRYFQGGGGAGLTLRYRTGDGAWAEVPPAWFATPR